MNYTIHEAAKELGVTAKTLRLWEELGKITAPARSAGGYRIYTDTDIRLIQEARATKAKPGKTYNIGYGDYPVVAKEDAAAYLAKSKAAAFKHGYPQPTAVQMEFRKRLLAKRVK